MRPLRTLEVIQGLRSLRLRPRSILLLAFAASLLLHFAITQWDVRFGDTIEAEPPLTVALTEMPPPPAPAPAPAPHPKPKPKRSVPVATTPAPAVVAQAEPAVEPTVGAAPEATSEPPPAPAPLD